MKFLPELLTAIIEGRKTVTRRAGPLKYKVGRIYVATDRLRFAKKGHAKWRRVKIQIRSHTTVGLTDITEMDAMREGLRPRGAITARDQFLLIWGRLHGSDPTAIVDRYEFEVVQ